MIKTPSTFKGKAAVFFSKEDITKLAALFKHVIVGMFSHSQPKLEEIRKIFTSFNLKIVISIGHLDFRHLLIRCKWEVDFLRIWTRWMWYIVKFPMRMFRWTPSFHNNKESSLALVWFSCISYQCISLKNIACS